MNMIKRVILTGLVILILGAACTPRSVPTSAPTTAGLTRDGVATLLAAPLPEGTLAPAPISTPDLTALPTPEAALSPTPTRAPTTQPAALSPTVRPAQPGGNPPPDLPAPTSTLAAPPSPTVASTAASFVPDFSHVFVIIFENKEFGTVVGSPQMPAFNRLAQENTLLTQYYGVRHPSLPNYLALIGGDTFGVTSDCESCYVDKPSLPDLLEAAGLTWRTYQEDMPSPCFAGSRGDYAQKHNPFMYFDPIRKDAARCQAGVVPFSQLETDLAAGQAPTFAFISPNLCNSGHDCGLDVVDTWMDSTVKLITASSAYDDHSLIVITWDEGQGEHSCCGLPSGGGRVAAVLVSPLARQGFVDDTPYSHYSLLATLAQAWGLEKPAHAADEQTSLILAPWKQP